MWWDVLVVDKNVDKKTLKRAYLKLIRTIDQDKDIAEFTKIRDAYELALRDIKSKENINKNKDLIKEYMSSDWNKQEDQGQQRQQIPRHISLLLEVYNNIEKRLNIDEWKKAFEEFSLKEELAFNKEYIWFFNRYYRNSKYIWDYINSEYQLINQQDFIWSFLIDGTLEIKYREYHKVPVELKDDFFEDYIQGFRLFNLSKYNEAALHLNKIRKYEIENKNMIKICMLTGYEVCDLDLFNQYKSVLKKSKISGDRKYAEYYEVKFKKKMKNRKIVQMKLPIADYILYNPSIINPCDELDSIDSYDKAHLSKGNYKGYYRKNHLNMYIGGLIGSVSIMDDKSIHAFIIFFLTACSIFLGAVTKEIVGWIFLALMISIYLGVEWKNGRK